MTQRSARTPERASRIQKRLEDLGFDALLLFDEKNIRYLTGFTGTDGVLLIGKRECILFVDGRFVTQAAEQVRGFDVRLYRNKLADLAAAVAGIDVKILGFESSALTFDVYADLKRQLHGGVRLKPAGDAASDLRKLKDPKELSLIARAIDVSHKALADIVSCIKPGAVERDIALALDCRMKTLGAEDLSFPTIVASGPRAALPHAEPGLRRIEPGDVVIIDYGAVVHGYHSDETCTFILADANEEVLRAYDIVKQAHDRAIDAVRAGVACREVDRIAGILSRNRVSPAIFPTEQVTA